MNQSNRRSAIFLMEIITAVLFFSLAGALCLEMFAKSYQIQTETKNLNRAADAAGNAAEILKNAASHSSAAAGDSFFPDCLSKEYAGLSAHGGAAVIYFDENWNSCAKEKCSCRMIITETGTDSGLAGYRIEVLDAAEGGTVIYALNLKLYIPQPVSAKTGDTRGS